MVIYKLTNVANRKVYVGATIRSVSARFQEHLWEARKDRAKKNPLYRDMRHFPSGTFHAEALAYAKNRDELKVLEEKYILQFKSNIPEFGYNIAVGWHGWHQSNTMKKQVSVSMKAWAAIPKNRARLLKIAAVAHKGHHHTLEVRERIRKGHLGVPNTAAHNEAIRIARTGTHWSQEVKDKISAANTGKKQSPETIAKKRASAKLFWVRRRKTKK